MENNEMNMREFLSKVNISRLEESQIDPEGMVSDLFQDYQSVVYPIDESFSERVKKYYVTKWRCTDSFVGSRLITFDGIPVFFTWQTGRKCDTNYYSLNDEKVKELILFLHSLCEKPGYNYTKAETSMEEDLEPIFDNDMEYSVNFTNQVLSNSGFYYGTQVYINREKTRALAGDTNYCCEEVVVRADGREERKIPVVDFKMSIYQEQEN
jgi:hypothetical protein